MTKEKNKPTLVFVRHAHRDKPIPDADNGISSKGKDQVQDLVHAYKKGKLPSSEHFWSSPKKRCIETLKPLAQLSDAKLVIEDLLDEQNTQENSNLFQKRIEDLIKKAKSLDETVYLCSHGDFIPEAIDFLTGKVIEVSKGEALVIEKVNGEWELL